MCVFNILRQSRKVPYSRNKALIWRHQNWNQSIIFSPGTEPDPDLFVLINANDIRDHMSHTEPACVNIDIVVIYKCWGLVKLSR